MKRYSQEEVDRKELSRKNKEMRPWIYVAIKVSMISLLVMTVIALLSLSSPEIIKLRNIMDK